MIGEIGGQLEADAAHWIKADGNRKPVVGFIAGVTAPAGRTMGHAGAIVGGTDDTAEAKKQIMRECGIHVVDSPAEIGKSKRSFRIVRYFKLKITSHLGAFFIIK
jgi:succinyl-CoA synthetase alpha subunit